jgi:hypothetical protein
MPTEQSRRHENRFAVHLADIMSNESGEIEMQKWRYRVLKILEKAEK